MNITSTTDGTTTTLALEGWLDTSTAPQLGDALGQVDSGCTKLVLDFCGLEYISSAGLRQVVSAHKKMRGALAIINVSAEVMQVFKMAGFDKRLNIS
jgi:anti-sigma B factor antagonist